MDPQNPPYQIEGYQILREIGQGGYGVVYMVKTDADQYEALKVVSRDQFENETPFNREISAIRKYKKVCDRHPALIQIFHVKKDEDRFFYVMPLADPVGGIPIDDIPAYTPDTLDRRLARRNRMPIETSIHCACHLLDGLQELHRAKLIHRDIKPSNVIFIHGKAVLSDIGLVTDTGRTVSMVGSPGYMPADGAGKVSGDIYAMGMMLYRMTSGKSPYEWPAMASQMSPKDRRLFSAFNKVLLRACDHRASRRFPSARSMATALRQVLHPPTKAVLIAKARSKLKLPALRSKDKQEIGKAVLKIISDEVDKIRRGCDIKNQWLSSAKMARVGRAVKRYFRTLMGFVPTDIISSCLLAEAIVEDIISRKRLLFGQAFRMDHLDEGKKNTAVTPQLLGLGKKVSVESLAHKYTFRDPDLATNIAFDTLILSLTEAIEKNWDEYQAALLEYSGPPGRQLSACAPPSS